MEKYNVTGMSCAACSARVEKAVKGVDGVSECAVSLLTNSMTVEGTADASDIIKAVKKAGYGAEIAGAQQTKKENTQEDFTKGLKNRLFVSLGFLAVLMYFSMGHMINLPLPEFFSGNYVAIGLMQLVLSAIIMVINQRFFISGVKGIIHKAPNMDTLVALGSAASFGYSTFALFMMTASSSPHELMHEFYFESAGMILTLITLGKLLEAYSKGKTTDAVKGLMKLKAKTATVIRDGKETVVSIEEVKIGDEFVVRPGENVPVDGVVLEGMSAVYESALTGESVPVDKKPGDKIWGATINQSGFVKCRAERVGEDTTLAQIIKMVEGAAATKAPIAKIADKVSGVFVPVVIAIAIITFIIWMAVGQTTAFALARAISVLVISCPCALGLATPVAIMVGSGVGAKAGILFKTAVSLEKAGESNVVVLDKTGTITEGVPVVTDIVSADNVTEDELMKVAYSLEKKSEHPLAKAIVAKAEKMNTDSFETENFAALPGNGVTAEIENEAVYGGNKALMDKIITLAEADEKLIEKLANEGKTPLLFAKGGKLLGIVAVADSIKSDSAEAIAQLKRMGIKTVMLTGDNRRTAEAIAKSAGVDEVYADTMPDGKAKVVEELKKQGRVMMVGDGINDAPALAVADVSVAIGRGVDIAIDAADVVLMRSSLCDVAGAIRLSRQTLKNIKENLFWAFFYNVIGIPLAAGAYIAAFGWELNPMFGAAAMSLSSFCVVSNALRLNWFDIKSTKRDRKRKVKAHNTEEITIKIEGMMCAHCEGTVTDTLEKLGYRVIKVRTDEKVAVFEAPMKLNMSKIKKAIVKAGFKVID